MENKRILIIDDDSDFSKELSEILSAEGYLVKTINDSFTANHHLATMSYDLILLDYKMSVLNGIDLLKQIKTTKPQTKVILISGRPFLEKVLESERATELADAVMNKPFDHVELINKIKAIFAGTHTKSEK